jgi:hypothetical protein
MYRNPVTKAIETACWTATRSARARVGRNVHSGKLHTLSIERGHDLRREIRGGKPVVQLIVERVQHEYAHEGYRQ